MKYFTIEEFDEMYRELMCNEKASYEMLFAIADKALLPTVKTWCKGESCLDSEMYNDVMQKTKINLMLYSVTGFFSKNNGSNYDPHGFKSWMFAVARNAFRDICAEEKKHSLKCTDPEYYINNAPDEDYIDSAVAQANCDKLNMEFMIVLDSDLAVYKVLTWITQGVIVISYGTDRIRANNILSKRFEKMTLDDMLGFVLRESRYIPWLQLDAAYVERLRQRLNGVHGSGKRLGSMVYSDFFMKKGSKASISDWTNRIDDYIKRRGTE